MGQMFHGIGISKVAQVVYSEIIKCRMALPALVLREQAGKIMIKAILPDWRMHTGF